MLFEIKNRCTGEVIASVEAESLVRAVETLAKSGANLGGANLGGANLGGANLGGAKLNWTSHALLSELLFRSAPADLEKRKFAGLVAISTDWCWPEFLALNDPLLAWALGVLAGYVQEGDGAPRAVRDVAERIKTNKEACTDAPGTD